MTELIAEVKRKALEQDAPPIFYPPSIHWKKKDSDKHEYRALAVFDLADRVVLALTGRYLRECIDRTLDSASFAFRCRHGNKPAPRHHDAVRKILAYRNRHRGKLLYVAECDIQVFFDAVDHQVARLSLKEVLERRCVQSIDQRAERLFDAYLDCYTFPRNVLRWEETELQKKGASALVKWPKKDLEEFHHWPMQAAIGIPQGGALSAVVANTLLDKADRALRSLRRKHNFLYIRYCDDMIIVSPSKTACRRALRIYLNTLKELKLPVYPPKTVARYGETHWEGKSRDVYRWGGNVQKGEIPWIQFVGYQIRYDGLIRIRKTSFVKHVKKVVSAVGELMAHLKSVESQQEKKVAVRKTLNQILHRLRMRLLSMSVGRPAVYDRRRYPRRMSWCGGFECLHRQPFFSRQLKALDRHRERQLRRLHRRLLQIEFPPAVYLEHALPSQLKELVRLTYQELKRKEKNLLIIENCGRNKALRFYGHPFSYFGQFAMKPRPVKRRKPSRDRAVTQGSE